jgi:hypothetical protein
MFNGDFYGPPVQFRLLLQKLLQSEKRVLSNNHYGDGRQQTQARRQHGDVQHLVREAFQPQGSTKQVTGEGHPWLGMVFRQVMSCRRLLHVLIVQLLNRMTMIFCHTNGAREI